MFHVTTSIEKLFSPIAWCEYFDIFRMWTIRVPTRLWNGFGTEIRTQVDLSISWPEPKETQAFNHQKLHEDYSEQLEFKNPNSKPNFHSFQSKVTASTIPGFNKLRSNVVILPVIEWCLSLSLEARRTKALKIGYSVEWVAPHFSTFRSVEYPIFRC